MKELSIKISSLAPSTTLSITMKAKQMKAEGLKVVSFGAGEPDFDTPKEIREMVVQSLGEGYTRYTPTAGFLELREAISRSFLEKGLQYSSREILVSCGAKHSIYNVLQVLCTEGDEVIIPSPFWVSYPEQVKAAGATPVFCRTAEKDGFALRPEKLQEVITERTKAIILNSPSNPTGQVYSRRVLSEIGEVLCQRDIYIISDEIYDRLVYEDSFAPSIASINESLKERTIVVNGVSKTYAMTGFRIGWAAGPLPIIEAMERLQDHMTSNPSSLSQRGAIAALKMPPGYYTGIKNVFRERRDVMMKGINSLGRGISCLKPGGAFYTFPNVSSLYEKSHKGVKLLDSKNLCNILLEKSLVAAIPGNAFGAPDHIRLSFATSKEEIERGMVRIGEFVDLLS